MVFCGFTLFLLSTFKTTKLFFSYLSSWWTRIIPAFQPLNASFFGNPSFETVDKLWWRNCYLNTESCSGRQEREANPGRLAPGPRRFQAKGRSSFLVLFGGRFRLFFCCDWTRTWRWSPWLTILYDHLMLKEEGHFRSTSLSNRE